jgi:hypothetical protein
MLKRIGTLFSNVGQANWTPFTSPALGLIAAAQLNFVERKYYWNGKEQREGSFATFSGATFDTGDDAGLIGTGVAANHDITLNWSALNITVPFVMAVVFRPKLLNATTQFLVSVEAATAPSQNRVSSYVSSANGSRFQIVESNVARAQQSSTGALTVDTNYCQAALVQTDLVRNSVSGATAGTEDTTVILPTLSLMRLLESVANSSPVTGRIRHVLFFQQTGGAEISQADLNTLSAELALI